MKISICLPYMKPDFDRGRLEAWCRLADGGEFASISCGERIIDSSHDMRCLMAAVAVLTERVRVVPSLYVLPMHVAVRVAKEVATLDILSAGRVTLTVGVGGREQDYQALEVPFGSFGERYQKMKEQVEIMRRVWRGEAPLPGITPLGPAPVQDGGPPVLAGVLGERGMKRVASWADGVYVFSMNGEEEELRTMLNNADQAWQQAGRSLGLRAGGCWYSLADGASERLRQYVYDYLKVAGEEMAKMVAEMMTRHTPEAVGQAIDNARRAGCEEFFLVPATADVEELERLLELLVAGRHLSG